PEPVRTTTCPSRRTGRPGGRGAGAPRGRARHAVGEPGGERHQPRDRGPRRRDLARGHRGHRCVRGDAAPARDPVAGRSRAARVEPVGVRQPPHGVAADRSPGGARASVGLRPGDRRVERVGRVPGGVTSVGRVLVVTNDFPTRRGGIETFVLQLCLQLDPAEVVVYTASMPGDREYDATLPFPVHRDPTGTLLPTPAVARRVTRVLREAGCDRVVFGAAAPLGLLGGALRRAGAERIVAITHGHEVWWARVPGARQLLRRIGDPADVLTYVSRW